MKSSEKLLKTMSVIFEKSKECKLTETFFPSIKQELSFVADYMNISQEEAFIFALIFNIEIESGEAEFRDIVRHLDSAPSSTFLFMKQINSLIDKQIIKSKKSKRYRGISSGKTFNVCKKTFDFIFEDKPIIVTEVENKKDAISFLEAVNNLIEERDDEEKDELDTFFHDYDKLEEEYQDIDLVKKVSQLGIKGSSDAITFYQVCWKAINGDDYVELFELAGKIYSENGRKTRFVQSYITETNANLKKGLLEMSVGGFFGNESQLKITDISKALLEENGVKFLKKMGKRDNVIQPENIVEKTLFYSESESEQIELLKNALMDENFKKMQETLKSRGLTPGVTAILHGHPGTGKTESVYQIAKATGRSIVKVDISKTKSAWFGESEKLVKRIFTDYYDFAKNMELKPILLFNEADAIISKRKELSSSDVSQTQNAIQNILLDEIERFDGILIATTNLVSNMDAAFERRFLFKVNFAAPTDISRAKIWESKLQGFTQEQYLELSTLYPLSGGQIDNIIRKKEIYEITKLTTVSFEKILDFCKEETYVQNKSVGIGFLKK